VSGVPTWPVASLAFVAGFAVAELTGVRALGGLVLLAAAAWCFARWRARAGAARAVALVVFCAACFVASHVLADALGAWGAVAAVAVLAGGAAWALADASVLRR
jgi:thiol:disulfide interchange protein